MTRFSVVIPVFNGESFLSEAIDSALSQSLEPIEIIVVDDGSVDASRQIAQRFESKGPVRVLSQPNSGPSAARNLGARSAKGEWLAFLDHDDRFERTYLEAADRFLMSNPGAGVLSMGVRILAENGALTPHIIVKASPESRYSTAGMLEGDVGTICTPIVRRNLFLESGGFDESLKANEDCHLWLRLSLITEIHQCSEPLLLYRKHSRNSSGDILGNARESVRSLQLLEEAHQEFREEFFSSFRKLKGKEYLRLGRELLAKPLVARPGTLEARRALVAAVTHRPARLRGWLYLVIAYIPGGPAIFSRFRRLELKRRQAMRGTELAAAFRETKRRLRRAVHGDRGASGRAGWPPLSGR